MWKQNVYFVIWNRTRPRALVQNQHTRELTGVSKTSHKHNKGPSRLSACLPGYQVFVVLNVWRFQSANYLPCVLILFDLMSLNFIYCSSLFHLLVKTCFEKAGPLERCDGTRVGQCSLPTDTDCWSRKEKYTCHNVIWALKKMWGVSVTLTIHWNQPQKLNRGIIIRVCTYKLWLKYSGMTMYETNWSKKRWLKKKKKEKEKRKKATTTTTHTHTKQRVLVHVHFRCCCSPHLLLLLTTVKTGQLRYSQPLLRAASLFRPQISNSSSSSRSGNKPLTNTALMAFCFC